MDSKKLTIRPVLNFSSEIPIEDFQNKTVRPILKLQHDLLLQFFIFFCNKQKVDILNVEKEKFNKAVNNITKKNINLKNQFLGLIIGQFTVGEFEFYKENNTDINTNYVSYQFYTQDTVDRFDLQLGAKAFWLDVEDDDGFGIALGAGVAFAVIDKLSLGLDVYYTPDVISSGDIENTLDIDLRLAYQMLENGQLFIGYRRFDADFEKGDVDIYDDAYFGVKFSF